MASIYIHIPFCKQACSYCDFHFSTRVQKKNELLKALQTELLLRKDAFKNQPIKSIYFGGGTPSLLSISELNYLLETIYKHYVVLPKIEITLEANPDDLTENYLSELSKTAINRLSIGVQSFFDADLQLMNRAHTAEESKKCLEIATQYFDNITIDLIYGMPNSSVKQWEHNLQTALNFGIKHLSTYALTVEEKTALHHWVSQKKVYVLPEDEVLQQFEYTKKTLENNGFIHYELSNFGKEGYFSVHNSGYWLGKNYVGIGPSAHSYNGTQRSWNIANNHKYIQALEQNTLPQTTENLTPKDQFNETLLIGLRTQWGVSLEKIKTQFGEQMHQNLVKNAQKHVNQHTLVIENNHLKTTAKGLFLIDGIVSDLFEV